jgi:hypothetical protein
VYFGHFAGFIGFFTAHLAVADAVFDERIILGARAAKYLPVEKIFDVHQAKKKSDKTKRHQKSIKINHDFLD